MTDSARWDGFELRSGDIIISTPPKCGTTWTQMICALLVFQTTTFERPLNEMSPWLDMLVHSTDDVYSVLAAQTHRRFIKTHTPMDGLPDDPNVTYVVVGRDARDAGISADNHRQNMNMPYILQARANAVGLDDIAHILAEGPPKRAESQYERFWEWVVDDTPVVSSDMSLRKMLHHLNSFWSYADQPNVVMLHYQDLTDDLGGQMRALATRLEISVPESLWPELMQAASFANMKEHAADVVPGRGDGFWLEKKDFFRNGSSGQWQEVFQPGDAERFAARVSTLVSDALSNWMSRD